jgi:hypothetical protein
MYIYSRTAKKINNTVHKIEYKMFSFYDGFLLEIYVRQVYFNT